MRPIMLGPPARLASADQRIGLFASLVGRVESLQEAGMGRFEVSQPFHECRGQTLEH